MKDVLRKGLVYCVVVGYEVVENIEVFFQEGDIFELLRVGQEGWWFVRYIGIVQEGWVLVSYLIE